MSVGEDGGWVGMTDAVALRSLSFPRKRESRDLCDRTDGIGRAALGSWCPLGVWELE